MQETLKHPLFETRRHLSRRQSRRVGGLCLDRTIERPLAPQNNDPLAHIYRLNEARDFDEVECQIRTEFITDIAERARDQHFYDTFEYRLTYGDLISSTGLSLRAMLDDGVMAAQNDRTEYGIARAEALKAQLPKILEWANDQTEEQLAFFSLAPSESELDPTVARKLYFKQDRMMSSNWLFEKTPDGVVMHAFSLDNHHLDMHKESLEELGLETSADTTLEEVTSAYRLGYSNGGEAVEAIRHIHDNALQASKPAASGYYFGKTGNTAKLNANQLINTRPEVYELYKEAVMASYEALVVGRVTHRFSQLIKELRGGFKGFEAPISVLNKRLYRTIEQEDVAELIGYLRSKVIPHFIYGIGQGVSLAESGADAVSRGVKYDGACPTSEERSPEAARASERAILEAVLFGRPLSAEKFISRTCPCCLPVAKTGEVARAWKADGVYGCEDCGHVVDICVGIVRQGNPTVRERNPMAVKKPQQKATKKVIGKNEKHRKVISVKTRY